MEGKFPIVLWRPHKLMPTVRPTHTSSHAVLISPVIEQKAVAVVVLNGGRRKRYDYMYSVGKTRRGHLIVDQHEVGWQPRMHGYMYMYV